MATVRKILHGKKLHLNLQLFDGIDSMPLRVFAVLSDNNGDVITPNGIIELEHRAFGYFIENQAVMPNLEYVTAHYFVKEPGQPSDEFEDLADSQVHGVDTDTFVNCVSDVWDVLLSDIGLQGTIGSLIKDRLDQKISSIDNNPADLIGTMEPDFSVMGFVDDEDQELCGFVDESELKGEVVDVDTLVGYIDSTENLIGVIDEH